MEWVTCLQNLWVEQKKKQGNKQQSKCNYNICFWGVAKIILRLFFIIYFFSFFKLGSAIVVYNCRLPYPRLKLFSFPLISFSFITSKMIWIKLFRFVLCRNKQGRWTYFNMVTINTTDTNLVPKQKRNGFQKPLTLWNSVNIVKRPFNEMSTFWMHKEVGFPTPNVVVTTYICYHREN